MDILLKGFFGGIVVIIVLVAEKYLGAKVAGVLGGIPLIFAISFAFVALKTGQEGAINFIKGGFWSLLPTLFFYLLLSFLTLKNGGHPLVNLTVTYTLSFTLIFLILSLIKT